MRDAESLNESLIRATKKKQNTGATKAKNGGNKSKIWQSPLLNHKEAVVFFFGFFVRCEPKISEMPKVLYSSALLAGLCKLLSHNESRSKHEKPISS
jgi:hypothetical protein